MAAPPVSISVSTRRRTLSSGPRLAVSGDTLSDCPFGPACRYLLARGHELGWRTRDDGPRGRFGRGWPDFFFYFSFFLFYFKFEISKPNSKSCFELQISNIKQNYTCFMRLPSARILFIYYCYLIVCIFFFFLLFSFLFYFQILIFKLKLVS
jgi:hypothetical protein